MRYSLTIDEHIGEIRGFNVKNVITIEGNSITELLGKFPLEINILNDNHIGMLNNKIKSNVINDEDIPF